MAPRNVTKMKPSELSTSVFVSPKGLFLRVMSVPEGIYSMCPIYGMKLPNPDSTNPASVIWALRIGPPKSVTNSWLDSEDGREFLDFIKGGGLNPNDLDKPLDSPDEPDGPDDDAGWRSLR